MKPTSLLVAVLAVLVVSSVATAGVAVGAATNDRFEPNDTRDSAPTIEAGTYEDLTLQSDEWDVYALSVGAGEPISVSVTVPKPADAEEPANDPYVYLMDANGDTIENADRETDRGDATTTYYFDYEFDSPQQVYVVVRGTEDSGTATPYDLTLRRAANDPNEPNGVPAKATTISPGTHEAVLQDQESDYYRFNVSAGQTINTTLTVPKAADGERPDNDLTLALADESGNIIEYADRETTRASPVITHRIHHEFESDRTLYLLVYGGDNSNTATDYDLTLRRAANDPNEPNGVPSKATPISPGEYGAVLQDQESDYYRFNVSAGQTINTTLTVPKAADGERPDNDLALALADESGEVIEYADRATTPAADVTTHRIHHEFESDRTLYLLVYGGDNSNTATDYDLTLRRAANDPNEPNGVLSKATVVSPGEYEAVLQDRESDYYALSVGPGGTVNVTMTVPKAADGDRPDNDVTLVLADESGDVIKYAERDDAPAADVTTHRLSDAFDSRRTVYVHVYGGENSNTATDYDLSITGGGATTPTPTATPTPPATPTPTTTPTPAATPGDDGTPVPTPTDTPTGTGDGDGEDGGDSDGAGGDGGDGSDGEDGGDGADPDEPADEDDEDDASGTSGGIGPGFGAVAALLALLTLAALGRRRA